MGRFARVLLICGVASLLAVGVWSRIASLGRYPELDGDEAWHAVQLSRMIQGKSFEFITATGLPLSSFHTVLELPGLLFLPRSLAILRIPTVITGLLAVALMCPLGSQMFGADRP